MNPTTDPTASVLRSHHLSVQAQVYTNGNCYVYRAMDDYRQIPVILKLLCVSAAGGDADKIRREVENQWACKHPNIVTIIDYFWYSLTPDIWVAVLELEQMTKDLAKDIQDRRNNEYGYSETDLQTHLMTLVSVFAYAQRMNLAHRDVKPHNIFMSGSTLKVGDFGSSRQVSSSPEMLSVTGTPCYLSPLLRTGFTRNRRYIGHNPFKSDVYSLGLTLLHMATLEAVAPFGNLEVEVPAVISRCRYSTVMKQWFAWLLAYDEANRPDFITIQSHIQGNSVSNASMSSKMSACEHVNMEEQPARLMCGHLICQTCFGNQLMYLSESVQIVCGACGGATEYVLAQGKLIAKSGGSAVEERLEVHVRSRSAVGCGRRDRDAPDSLSCESIIPPAATLTTIPSSNPFLDENTISALDRLFAKPHSQ